MMILFLGSAVVGGRAPDLAPRCDPVAPAGVTGVDGRHHCGRRYRRRFGSAGAGFHLFHRRRRRHNKRIARHRRGAARPR